MAIVYYSFCLLVLSADIHVIQMKGWPLKMCIIFTIIMDKAAVWDTATGTLLSHICHLVVAPVVSTIVTEQGRHM
jgi:hypothetical protein